jgi:hypothetical protein
LFHKAKSKSSSGLYLLAGVGEIGIPDYLGAIIVGEIILLY